MNSGRPTGMRSLTHRDKMTGAILSGGQSRRMGFNKAFIKLGNETLIERAVGVFSPLFSETILIANDIPLYQDLGVTVYSDLIKGAGSLGGIFTALFHSTSDHTFVAACDMPFLDARCIERVLKDRGKAECVIPFIGGRLHPLHALYSKKCMKEIEGAIREGDLRITALFDRIRTRRLTEDDFKGLPIALSVENINTREELLRSGIEGQDNG